MQKYSKYSKYFKYSKYLQNSVIFALLLIITLLMTSCGFHLRGSGNSSYAIPYEKFFIQLPKNADVRIWLERYIRASNNANPQNATEILEDFDFAENQKLPEQERIFVDGIFQQLNDSRQKQILSLTSFGRVREYRLQLHYQFQVINSKGEIVISPNTISLTRDISYDDNSLLSKDLEENILWKDLTNDLVNQIMFRLTAMQPKVQTQTQDE